MKKFLTITGIVVLLLALVGFWGYNNYVKPDPEIKQQLASQFGADFFNFDKELDNEAVDNSGKAANNVESVDALVVPAEGGKVTGSTPVNENTVEKLITQEEINMKYKPQFAHLQSAALGRLDTLYSAAIQEYTQGKKAGTVNRSELAQKYIQAGTMLEASMDGQFYSRLDAMKAELIANNFPTDTVDAYKAEYEQAKSDKRSGLLAKVRK